MPDKYESFSALKADKEYGFDYLIQQSELRSATCIFSPHGGKIEWGVSELVRAVGDRGFSWYLFEGNQETGNSELHITSHRFDEPRALTFLKQHRVALALHGEDDNAEARTYLGGRNTAARNVIGEVLRSAGFEVPERTPEGLAGEEPINVCNLCSSPRGGVQLEITAKQRAKFFTSEHPEKKANRESKSQVFDAYVAALAAALSRIQSSIQSF